MERLDGTLAYYCEYHCPPTGGGWQVGFQWDTTEGVVHRVKSEDIMCPGCGKEGTPRWGYAQVIDRPPESRIEAVESEKG